jgi:sugar (pentulose or hexulose) kinase
MKLLLGIDLGTSYFKVGLFDRAGKLKGLGRVAVPKKTPALGRCELSVESFWQALRRGLEEALVEASAQAAQIVGLSYSSQANTFVLIDRWDRPLTPLVIWTDERGEPVEEELKQFADSAEFGPRTGFQGITGAWAVAKWRWWQKNQPQQWAETRRVMTLSDYLTFSLTGERVGDASTAAFLGIYDLADRKWWSEALRNFEIDPDLLSDPLLPGTRCGHTFEGATARLGLPTGIPFTVGGLDHHVAGLGSGLGRLGDASISTGTVLASMTLVDEVIPQSGCYHGPHFDGAHYYRLAFDSQGAGQLEDYQRSFAPNHDLDQLLALAALAPPGGGPVLRPGSGVSDPEHGKFVRQLLERIAMGHRTLLRQVMGSLPARNIVATGGGARSALWLQIKAAMLGATIVKPECQEPACLGASLLAGVGAGIFQGLDDASHSTVREEIRYDPDPELLEFYREFFWPPIQEKDER